MSPRAGGEEGLSPRLLHLPPNPANSSMRAGEKNPRGTDRRYSWMNAEIKMVENIAGRGWRNS